MHKLEDEWVLFPASFFNKLFLKTLLKLWFWFEILSLKQTFKRDTQCSQLPRKSNFKAYIEKVLVVHDIFNTQTKLAISELFQALNGVWLRFQQRADNTSGVELKYEKAEDYHVNDGEVKWYWFDAQAVYSLETKRGEFEHIMSTHVPTTNSPCCAMTLTKINMPCRSRSKAAYTRRNCRFCDSCKLVNFFFMLTKSLLWDLLTFLEYVGVLLLHAVTFRCRDLWRRLIAPFAFRMTSVPLRPMKLPLSLWFGFNFDLLTLLMSAPLCAHPFRLTTFMVDG